MNLRLLFLFEFAIALFCSKIWPHLPRVEKELAQRVAEAAEAARAAALAQAEAEVAEARREAVRLRQEQEEVG